MYTCNTIQMKNTPRFYVIAIIIGSIAVFCGVFFLVQKNNTSTIQRNSERYVIFPKDYPNPLFPKNIERFTPSTKQTETAMRIVQEELRGDSRFYDIDQYYVQWFGYVKSTGEKMMWGNYSCANPPKDWKENISITQEKGKCYFLATLDIDNKKLISTSLD